jgi:hypothetical protein
MSQENNNNEKGNKGTSGTSFGAKAGYIGTGVLIGLIAYPFVKKALAVAQPKIDEMLNGLTGKAEGLAEKASDMMFRAKEGMKKGSDVSGEHDHDHEGHDHDGHKHS